MGLTVGTQEILEMLGERGIRAHREKIAELSDALGLHTRNVKANWSPRRWRPVEAELLVLAFELKQWHLSDEVLRTLLVDGGESINTLVKRLRATLTAYAQKAQVVASDAEQWETTRPPAKASSAA